MRRQWGAEPGRADASPRQSTSNIGHTTTSLRLPVLPAMTVSTPSSARHRPKSVPLLQGQALATAKGRVTTAGSSLPSLQCGSPSTTASRQRQLQVQEIADRLARLPGECASPRAGQPRWSRSAKKAVASRTKPAVDPVSPLSTSSSNRDTLKCIDDITPSWTPPLRAPVVTVLPPFALLQSEEDVIGKLAASALDSGVDSDADAISVKVDCIITEVVDKVKSRCNIGAGGKHTQQTANASMEQKEHELGSAETRTATTITIASVATTKIQSADILGRDNYVSILTADGQETIPVHIAKLSDTLAHIIRACGISV